MNTAVTPEIVAAEIAYRFERDRVTTRPGRPAARRRTLREWLSGVGSTTPTNHTRRTVGRTRPDASTAPRSRHV